MKNQTNIDPSSDRMSIIIIIVVTLFIAATTTLAVRWHGESDMYVMPNGFTGKVTVYYNQPDGVPEKMRDGRRIFEIPETGILYTQSVYKRKWDSYYYALPGGRLQPLMYGSVYMGHGIKRFSTSDSCWIADVDTKKIKQGNSRKYVETYYVVTDNP